MTIKTRLQKLEQTVKPGEEETTVIYVNWDRDANRPTSERMTVIEWGEGQESGLYPTTGIKTITCTPDPRYSK